MVLPSVFSCYRLSSNKRSDPDHPLRRVFIFWRLDPTNGSQLSYVQRVSINLRVRSMLELGVLANRILKLCLLRCRKYIFHVRSMMSSGSIPPWVGRQDKHRCFDPPSTHTALQHEPKQENVVLYFSSSFSSFYFPFVPIIFYARCIPLSMYEERVLTLRLLRRGWIGTGFRRTRCVGGCWTLDNLLSNAVRIRAISVEMARLSSVVDFKFCHNVSPLVNARDFPWMILVFAGAFRDS